MTPELSALIKDAERGDSSGHVKIADYMQIRYPVRCRCCDIPLVDSDGLLLGRGNSSNAKGSLCVPCGHLEFVLEMLRREDRDKNVEWLLEWLPSVAPS